MAGFLRSGSNGCSSRVVEPVAVWLTPATDHRRHRRWRDSRGFGFADIRAEDVQRVLRLDGARLHGRALRIELAKGH
jgi:hypothetical protein